MATMRYDRDGFPVPTVFEPRTDADTGLPPRAGGRAPMPADHRTPSIARGDAVDLGPVPHRSGRGLKQLVIVAVLAFGLVPAIVGPELMPLVRLAVVRWSLERAMKLEANDDVSGALAEVGRALDWGGADDPDLLCQRAWLRLHDGNPAGAIDDARRAETLAPTSLAPLRLRGLAEVVRGNADEALADATLVVERSVPGDADALNHRAYIRALVNRELPAALADIEAAIDRVGPAVSADLLDTRGFVLHLLGRNQEALEQMNDALDRMLQERRRIRLVASRDDVDPVLVQLKLRSIEHALAVMYQHRGLICRTVGHEEQAKQDFDVARAKGYDPARGVF